MEEIRYMVCMRADELTDPVEGSTTTACVECGGDIWISPASRTEMGKVGAMPVCARCAKRIAQEFQTETREFGAPSSEQFEEVINRLRRDGLGAGIDALLDPDLDNFEALKGTARLAAEAMPNAESDWGAMMVIEDYDGHTFPPVSLTDLMETVPKELVGKQLIPGMAQASAAKRVFFGFSTWALTSETGIAPEIDLSEHPDRTELLVLLEVTADGVEQVATAAITRDGVHPPTLGEWNDLKKPKMTSGIFVDALVPTLQLVRSQQESN